MNRRSHPRTPDARRQPLALPDVGGSRGVRRGRRPPGPLHGAPTPRRLRHQLSDRAQLLESAGKIFCERGYSGTSIRDVARAAGLSVGGVYQFFGGKDELYLAVFEALWREFFATVADALRPEDCRDQLRMLTARWIDHVETRRDLLRILTDDLGRLRPHFKRAFLARLSREKRRFRSLVVRLMRQGVDAGVLRPVNAELLAIAYLGVLYVSTQDVLATGARGRRIARADSLLEVFLCGAALPGSRPS
jgi:AcrR family transcriptional regulator